MRDVDVLIIGAGAAGLMCAIEAGKKGRKVLILDHANKVGKKILMSGGGRCNFTNYHIIPSCYLSENPHFCKSALSRYTQWDFIALVKAHHIPFHEKTLGQLFCDNKAKDLVDVLISLCEDARVDIQLNTTVASVAKAQDGRWIVASSIGKIASRSLVVATGGLSIPTMGASSFAYKIAQQFGLNVWPTRPGLVPFTLDAHEKARFAPLSGISVDALVQNERIAFRENVLFTHRGLSGPAVLQISSYWHPGESIQINLLPECDLFIALKFARETIGQKLLSSFLAMHLPKRVVDVLTPQKLAVKKLAGMTNEEFEHVAMLFNRWTLKLNSTEGYRTAEVTIGGVDCNALSSKTMEVKTVPNLYFIGEALDVTGWLGGYNFQWAWSSGWAAGQVV